MEHKRLGVAVIGSGRIGTLRANMAARHPSVHFLAVSDKDPARAASLAESVRADFYTGDNLQAISHPEVTTVIISTSEHEHTESILQALELHKPVLVEKPIALTLEDADRIVVAAEKSGAELRIGYSRRFERRWMLAKEQIVRGRIGPILGIFARAYNSRAQMFQMLQRSPGVTPVTDALTYWVDMAGWFLEGIRPVEVFARGYGKVFKEAGYAADDVTSAIVTFENGTVVSLGVCYALPARFPTFGQLIRCEILGEAGVMLFDQDNKENFLYTEKGIPHSYVPEHALNMLFLQSTSSGDWAMGNYWGPVGDDTRCWLDHLATGCPCLHTTPREARQTLEITLAIEESARNGRPIKLPLR